MADADTFREAIHRIRSGDQRAAVDLVQKYGPIIRREVRLNMEDARLRRMFDSMDVVQSVLASFFIRTAAGEFELESPEQLAGLLVQMARNKAASAARKHYRHCRDARRNDADDAALQRVANEDSTPSEMLANAELLHTLRGKLTSEEQHIAKLRAEGHSWDEIARALGGKAQARRMQLTRGIERAARTLGLARLYE